MPLGLILSEGKTTTYTSFQGRVGNVIDGQRRRGPNESRDKDSPPTNCQRPRRRANEQVELMITSCLWNGKMSLKVDEPQVDQQSEDVERKWEYYHIIIFPEWNEDRN